MLTSIPFPEISPVIFSITLFGFTFALRWYAMGYIVGILIGWWIAARAIKRPSLWRNDTAALTRDQIEDLLTWIVLGVIFGGRIGYVLFYGDGQFRQDPLSIIRVWDGGMSFHGGFIGVCVAVIVCARKYGSALGDVANVLALTATPAIFLVRITNFINAELYGRATDLPWGMKFPSMCVDPVYQTCAVAGDWFYTGTEVPRHPSQLYEAGLEGLLLGAIILFLAFSRGWLKRQWSLVAVFLMGYGLSRFAIEFVRQPDVQFTSADNPIGWAYDFGNWGLTQGQALSLPMILVGLALVIITRRMAKSST
ncbi:prolipoprotein diacylglyceryl transferase [Octadecabacter sp. 1_MG-2023]|uniref:prolipoprotein diacylglyceryl transferase n=1 Tax=unclassified Octadecabacter TaxID=196158 RepID=UPI001C07F327|nr:MULTISPECIES: prolipoprotein diacylglyceryl transferase [unclassified Octadecabacter]MBU2991952.1 prolipoprotein diacylglyceryl transferase [Octadecabacter sp. B2R22]MDO6735926.1 prolipoprotein diacylglyceryl transferase [Octadecabacter sp. 1_MG-2023]